MCFVAKNFLTNALSETSACQFKSTQTSKLNYFTNISPCVMSILGGCIVHAPYTEFASF